ncbi:hypothetical protein NFI96_003512 [Prochilodus magdalenae]|nr:hypothetical protein NFI96_003512 [Prochilodus magdalenae]
MAGREFATAFMQNYIAYYGSPVFQVQITSIHSNCWLTVSVPKLNFVQKEELAAGEGLTITLPGGVEVYGSQRSSNTVLIQASQDVCVTSLNAKFYTADTTVVYPMSEWGVEYIAFTPSVSPPTTLKELMFINGGQQNTVELHLQGEVQFQGSVYAAGKKIRPRSKSSVFSSIFRYVLIFLCPSRVKNRSRSTAEQRLQDPQVRIYISITCSMGLQAGEPAGGTRMYDSFMMNLLSTDHFCYSFSLDGQAGFENRALIVVPSKNIAGVLLNGVPLSSSVQWRQVQKSEYSWAEIVYMTGSGRATVSHPDAAFGLYAVGLALMNGYGATALCTVISQSDDCSIISKLDDTGVALGGHAVIREECVQEGGVSTQPWGVPVLTVLVLDVRLPILTDWGLSVRKFSTQLQRVCEGCVNGSVDCVVSGTVLTVRKLLADLDCQEWSPWMCLMTILLEALHHNWVPVTCYNFTCDVDEECQMVDFTPTCVKKPIQDKDGICWAMGDPHYRTFDGRYYDFMGACTYIITKNCDSNSSLPYFEVLVQNENRGDILVSYVGIVTVTVGGITITIDRSQKGRVRVDHTFWTLPLQISEPEINVSQSGLSVTIQTYFGLTVQFDWDTYLLVTLPATFKSKVCGLCGNFNGNLDDDLGTPYNMQAPSVEEFGISWKVPNMTDCVDIADGRSGIPLSCDIETLKLWEGEQDCGLLNRTSDGPFSGCYAVIDPNVYMQNCLFDTCMTGGLRLYLCKALEVYAAACQRAGVLLTDWREAAKCSYSCPENSHYELCGSACPATCMFPNPATNCSLPCVETCTCNPGFVLSGATCVPSNTCGCSQNGRYVPAGESFWADDHCSTQCSCPVGGGQMVCESTGCKAGQQCQVLNGIRDCYPISQRTCLAFGDPHYLSFDGRRFDYQGTGVYQLVGMCSSDPRLVPVEVLVQNEFRGSRAVSFTKLLQVKVYNLVIIISREYKGSVMVNGVLLSLPQNLNNGQVSVFKSGWSAVVQTSFGLTVSFDWNSIAAISVPSTYMSAVCGLCGNYNGKPEDDLTLRGANSSSTQPDEFGASWKIADISGYAQGCADNCTDSCNVTQSKTYESMDYCGLIFDPTGPFMECQPLLDPAGFFDACVLDVCAYGGRRDILCQAISAYMSACQDVGARVYSWRTAQFCGVQCPVHSHYEVCGPGCPATCYSLRSPLSCQRPCKEGCVCDQGHILSGDDCVPFAQCGCHFAGQYYTQGQVFYSDSLCQTECRCMEDGQVVCRNVSCGLYESCVAVNGVRQCQPVGKAVCEAAGDPHYTSFDGLRYDFQGGCRYTLSQTCGLQGTNLVPFSVEVENERWPYRASKVSVTKQVSLDVFGYAFVLRQNMAQIWVNGLLTNLPWSLNDTKVQISKEGINHVMTTDFGLRVTYDLSYYVTVTVPSTYRNKTCGLCGNYDGNPSNDFLLPGGNITTDITAFGKAWKVAVPGVECEDGYQEYPECSPSLRAVFETPEYCGLLSDPMGPFASCHAVVDPSTYLSNCVYDVCLSEGSSTVACLSVAAYAFQCHRAGVELKSWRTESFCRRCPQDAAHRTLPTGRCPQDAVHRTLPTGRCPKDTAHRTLTTGRCPQDGFALSCPAHSHYELCADTCSAACPRLTDIITCSSTCTEGCTCDPGYLFNGQDCVEYTQCGCYEDGRMYKPGEVVYLAQCQKRCMCDPVMGLMCDSHTCSNGTQCMVRDGIMDCLHTDPCLGTRCHEKEMCLVIGTRAECVPLYTATCWAWGDPHYLTFDNYQYNFQGTCSYILSKTCGQLDGLEPFSVTESNDHRGNNAVSYVREVEVEVYGITVTIQKYEWGQVMVNGERLFLPLVLLGGRVKVQQVGSSASLETDFGLRVSYDWDSVLYLQLPSSYFGRVCGLCGNFNGLQTDELSNPAAVLQPTVDQWAGSWRTNKSEANCTDGCESDCPVLSADQQTLYNTDAYCGALASTSLGVFTSCHAVVDPAVFQQSCVYDLALNDGNHRLLCDALEAYVSRCRLEGIVITAWREKFNCPMRCQPHSHYEACASPCTSTCPSPLHQPNCTGVCVEACVCDPGFFLSGSTCVPADQCGCFYEGRYYQQGQSFWADESCQRQCVCDSTLGVVACRAASCSAKETCTVVDGHRTCLPISNGTCEVYGDPHYRTFDGQLYDFQGSCMYQLVALCSNRTDLVSFNVTVLNERRGSSVVSFTRTAMVSVFGVTITMTREYPYEVLLDGLLVDLPLEMQDKLLVYYGGNGVVLETIFGLQVTFDRTSRLLVSLPSTYAGAVCGLCGNFSGDIHDDFSKPDGSIAPDAVAFGQSWQVGSTPDCSSAPLQDTQCLNCTGTQREDAQRYCSIITDRTGPFTECHAMVDPGPYADHCVFDTYQYQGRQSVSCDAIAVYVSACQSKGVAIRPWRNDTFCPSCGQRPVVSILWGSILWGSVLWSASSGQRPVVSVLWGSVLWGSVLWSASSGQRPVGQRLVVSVQWSAPNGQRPVGQCPVGQRLVVIVLWDSVLWAASCGQRPVVSVLWSASGDQCPVGSVRWAASCGQRPVSTDVGLEDDQHCTVQQQMSYRL